MTIEEKAFEKTKWFFERLESYGFQKNTESREVQYVYHTDLLDGAFEVEILVTEDGKVKGTVLDSMTEEEYFQIRVESGMGAYVHTVRHAYEELLADIAEKCTEPLPFVSDQANRLTAAIFRKYGEKPDFPWSGENESAGVFRNPENQKWYGLIMRVEENRLTKQKEDQEKLDILNLKIREEEGETLRAEKGIYPAWHMNHRTWISVRLDDTLTDERILELIEDSRSFTQNQRAKKKASGERKSWIVPANPKIYDIVSDFDVNEYSDWKQGRGVEEGDFLYMYVGVPYQAILYRCEVIRAHLPWTGEDFPDTKEYLEVRILDRYPKDLFQRKSVLAKFGVTTVRGPRFMPEELEKYIQEQSGNTDNEKTEK